VGYGTYIDLIDGIVAGKKVIRTPMTREVERVEAALASAAAGEACAIVSSGDPGIYAMAGLVLEICQKKGIPVRPRWAAGPAPLGTLVLEVVPGIPALCAGAALLGAPLTHDFAAVSLSDLLTPWAVIEERLEAAARADFVVVLYNPKSRRRSGHLETAQRILLRHRKPETPVGVVMSAMRKEQSVEILPLDRIHEAAVNMQTVLIVGSSRSSRYLDFMVTPRGYASKYDLS